MPCMLDAIDLVAIRTLSLDIDPRSDQIYFNRGSKVVQDFSETTRAAAFFSGYSPARAVSAACRLDGVAGGQ